MPDMQNKGKKRVYPKLVVNRQLNTKEFLLAVIRLRRREVKGANER